MTNALQAQIDQFTMPHPSGTGEFQISVARHPHRSEAQRDVPILFVLDADMVFALAAEIARLRGTSNMLPTAMVVGIGYGADFTEMSRLRTADLTPPLSAAGKESMGDLSSLIGDKDGGAEAFLTFLADQLVPEIHRRYPESVAGERFLFGHSLAGLFTAYAMLTRPGSFAAFLCSSPSLWWDQFAIMNRLPAFAEKLGAVAEKPRAMISVGGNEQDPPTAVPSGLGMSLQDVQAMVAASRMVDGAAEFASTLRESGLPDVQYFSFAGEDHMTALVTSLMRGLVVALPPPD